MGSVIAQIVVPSRVEVHLTTSGRAMLYRNSELRLDQIVTYINDEKINLSPVFQRGHVWSRSTRQKLVKNILDGKPIPAIFLYKEAVQGRSSYTYNILDGKQRLESIILFIGNDREDWQIPRWKQYFFDERHRKDVISRSKLQEASGR